MNANRLPKRGDGVHLFFSDDRGTPPPRFGKARSTRRLCSIAFAIALFAIVPTEPAHAQPQAVAAARDPVEDAVDRGLAYLACAQSKDGSWPSGINTTGRPRPNIQTEGDPAITALAVMAFLSAGHVPGEGLYGDRIALGIRFVAQGQLKNGLFAGANLGGVEMYYHGICTLMLAEVVGMTDGRTAEEMRGRLQSAVKIILEAQRRNTTNDRGGWRYGIGGTDADLSVTGWQFLALRAAKNVGCDIPSDRIDAALAYVKRCYDAKSGGFTYTAYGRVTEPCTGVGILCLELSGKDSHQSPEALKAAAYLLKNPISIVQPHFHYGVYYVAQAMFQVGDNFWKSYRERLHELLLRSNSPNIDGAWDTQRGVGDAHYGQAYATAMAILALTVEYRYLPIYQRFEEPLERDGD